MKLFSTLALSLVTSAAFAHHGSNGQFNHDIPVEVTGVITEFRLVNPHAYVYFDAVGENGETQEWRCEMRAASRLRSQGWTEEMFAPGTTISIEGSQARREEFGCYTAYVTFADGRRVERAEQIAEIVGPPIEEADLAAGTPILHGRWQSNIARGYTPTDAEQEAARSAWTLEGPQPDGREGYVQSELGMAASAGFSDEVNPRFHCQASNIFHDWTFNQAINEIEQSEDKIIIKYGFMDILRTIHLNMEEHPDSISPSRSGHSIGWWEGDTLVVDTIGFAEGWISVGGGRGRGGVKHSEQLHTVERFDVSEDGSLLVMTYSIEDPLYLEAPYRGQFVHRKSLEPFVEYVCEDLTEEVTEGF